MIEVEGDDVPGMHHRFAAALDDAYARIRGIQQEARSGATKLPHGHGRPMIVLRTPRGGPNPAEVDSGGGSATPWRAHQVPLSGVRDNAEHLAILESWSAPTVPDELFLDDGGPAPGSLRTRPPGGRCG